MTYNKLNFNSLTFNTDIFSKKICDMLYHV